MTRPTTFFFSEGAIKRAHVLLADRVRHTSPLMGLSDFCQRKGVQWSHTTCSEYLPNVNSQRDLLTVNNRPFHGLFVQKAIAQSTGESVMHQESIGLCFGYGFDR